MLSKITKLYEQNGDTQIIISSQAENMLRHRDDNRSYRENLLDVWHMGTNMDARVVSQINMPIDDYTVMRLSESSDKVVVCCTFAQFHRNVGLTCGKRREEHTPKSTRQGRYYLKDFLSPFSNGDRVLAQIG